MKTTKGVLLFAHNNEEIDYIKIAYVNALMIKKNLRVGVTLVTDEGTADWARETIGQKQMQHAFEHVIIKDRDYVYQQKNIRIYKDTKTKITRLPFYNCDHWMAYDLTPYDETLFIDADYLIMSDALNNCWGSNQDIMINKNIREILDGRQTESPTLDTFGIDLYWATCIYFKKTEVAKHMFSLAHYVYDNYTYFRDLYQFPGSLFRNDFAFSIAVHMMNGFNETGLIKELPIAAIYKSFDHDDIISINGINDITLLLEKETKYVEFLPTRWHNIDIHIMNKYAIVRHADALVELYT